MITQQQAEAVVLKVINQPDLHWPGRPELVITEVQPHPVGWLVYYQAKQFLSSGNVAHSLVGNGPILISSRDGTFARVGTTAPMEERIAEAEQQLLKESEARSRQQSAV